MSGYMGVASLRCHFSVLPPGPRIHVPAWLWGLRLGLHCVRSVVSSQGKGRYSLSLLGGSQAWLYDYLWSVIVSNVLLSMESQSGWVVGVCITS